jgi:molybdopterin molybdotransferase
MDGYALCVELFSPQMPLQIGEARPGGAAAVLEPGRTLRIFTGAPVPSGADAVVMQEATTRSGEHVVFQRRPTCGQHLRRRGEELLEGSVALAPGQLLTPPRLALAAALQGRSLTVSRRPRVAIVPTGSELGVAGDGFWSGPVVESTGVALTALVEGLGGRARLLPPVADDASAIVRVVRRELPGVDVLLTIGGVSVGDHDHVPAALAHAGVREVLHQVAMRPGKPVWAGTFGDAIVLGLPGNPTSSLVTFAQLGAPVLRALLGRDVSVPRPTCARLAHAVAPRNDTVAGRLELARAVFELRPGAPGPLVRLHSDQSSGALLSLAHADCLVRLPAHRAPLTEGTWVEVDRWTDLIT